MSPGLGLEKSEQTQQINSSRFVELSSISRRQCENCTVATAAAAAAAAQLMLGHSKWKKKGERDWVLMTGPGCSAAIEMPFGKFSPHG